MIFPQKETGFCIADAVKFHFLIPKITKDTWFLLVREMEKTNLTATGRYILSLIHI